MARDKRLNIRISEELKTEMDRTDRVWSDFVRNAIREELMREDTAVAETKISRLVRECNDDLEKLWILHMFATGLSKRRVYQTAETLFGEPKDDVVDDVVDAANDYEVSLNTRDELQEAIARQGREKILNRVRTNIRTADRKVGHGIYLLTHYVNGEFGSDLTYMKTDGFERTWRIYSDLDAEEANFDRIIELGLAYSYFYDSNAYHYYSPWIPEYALQILKEVREDPEAEEFQIHRIRANLSELLDKERVQEFLRWMNGPRRRVDKHSEDEQIRDHLEENDLNITVEEFEQARRELIQANALFIDYSPHRSSTGGRSSRPSRWVYKITDSGLQEIAEQFLTKRL